MDHSMMDHLEYIDGGMDTPHGVCRRMDVLMWLERKTEKLEIHCKY